MCHRRVVRDTFRWTGEFVQPLYRAVLLFMCHRRVIRDTFGLIL